MAKKKETVKEPEIVENISSESLDDVMSDRYAIYAKYVIQDRAIPDVRDGLKPVQRRIIYGMYQNGNTSDKPTKKCAKIVGDIMGRFHPHGDSSIYDALVRLSQPWKMSEPLVQFQGNNGSIDDDPAAAYRYTEARLNQFAENLISDIDKNTVDMTLNFDDTEFEPVVLPCRYPNLYVNGSEGIAVAIATEIPPHNLNEMCEAAIYQIQHPNCTLDELLEIVKGPDFPTGGTIYAGQGLRDIYETGRGRIEIASKVAIESSDKGVNSLVISEIPYGVIKKQLAFQIDTIRKNHEIDGIQEVKDLSAGDSIKIVVEIKKDVNPEIVLAYLMKKTQLKVSYSSNIVAICDKHPKTLSLKEYLTYYTDHQIDVITRRSKFDLKKAQSRLEIVDGLIKSVSIINEIIAIIRKSKDKADSKKNLMQAYGFSEPQAEAIVTMRLYKLSNTDVQIYIDEKAKLENTIEDLTETLANPNKLKRIIVNDLKEIIKVYGTPRRSVIEEKQEEIIIDKRDLVAKEDVYVVITKDGYIKRSSLKSYKSSNEQLPGLKQNDSIVMSQIVNTIDYILAFTNKGNFLMLPVHEIQENKWKDEGKHVNYISNLPINESIIKCIVVKDFNSKVYIGSISKSGQIKKTLLNEFYVPKTSKPIGCMRLLRDDEVADVCVLNGNNNIMVMTSSGKETCFNENEITPTKLKTSGVKAISSLKNGYVVAMISTREAQKCKFMLVTNKGFYKICDFSKFEVTDRLGRTDMVIKSFKSDVHDLKYCSKINNRVDLLDFYALMEDGSVKNFIINDFTLTPADKYCKTNLDNFNSKDRIKDVFQFNVEVIDFKTPVDEPSKVKKVVSLETKSEEQKEEVKIITVDSTEEIKNSSDEENYEQISIFDDMGD
ncbi:MAG: DNA topoisomerase IV subunit A [Bacilli bacterium]|nr:DNA topoisomerase IV subunit A [Bacilli bacterium]